MIDAAAIGMVLLLTGLAGIAVPIGGFAARLEHLREGHLREDILLGIVAFGGGALLSAVALVLLPEGTHGMSWPLAVGFFVGGAVLFLLIDHAIEKRGGQMAQMLAMLMDAVPESIALGAAVALGGALGPLLAVLVAVQNLPEGFNAYRELRATGRTSARSMVLLLGVTLATIVAGVGGLLLADLPQLVAATMTVASGGIVYLLFHDIAPEAHRKGHWAPTLGAVAGFAVGLGGAIAAGMM